ISVVKKMFMGIGQGLSLFVRKVGLKLISNEGPVSIQAQNDTLELLARQGINITSTEDEIHITAKKRIVLNAGGSYVAIEQCSIESATAGDYLIKAAHFDFRPKAAQEVELPALPPLLDIPPELHEFWPSFSGGNIHYERSMIKNAAPVKEPELVEEEEEEEEITEGITLRIGLFFDGRGTTRAMRRRPHSADNRIWTVSALKSWRVLRRRASSTGLESLTAVRSIARRITVTGMRRVMWRICMTCIRITARLRLTQTKRLPTYPYTWKVLALAAAGRMPRWLVKVSVRVRRVL
ncbi:DUF2345 domain-containing protein, partial [Pseudomonas sp. W2-17]|uniref:DUF2345 domain-containing protein n=1 Tax=Pseudomonas sp. W2-17 TaxID=3058039 RepID=UPI0034E0ADC1